MLRAGNQQGKTYAGAAEAAIHATGRYPKDWDGRRWDKGTAGWACGVSNEIVRDTTQRLLLGPVGERGTGLIPKRDIVDATPARGIPDLVDTIVVRHISGGTSRIRLKSYEQGREKFQADTIDWFWADEEPDLEIYTEMLSRTNATNGIGWMTMTPLLGMSKTVMRFLMEPSPDRADINMTIDDAEHIPPEQRKRIIDSYPAHEREARINGTPILGSGRIFPVAEETIQFDAMAVPDHWKVLGALDFGWDHPTAAIKLAWDVDADCVYITHAYRASEQTPIIHAAALRPWGDNLPWAWPHDGYQHDKGSGHELANQYRDQKLAMIDIHAQFEDDRKNGTEASLMDMLDRMQTGRLKVARHLTEWFEEFRLYHRKDGKVVKERDDLQCLHPETEVITDKGVFPIATLIGKQGKILSTDGKWQRYKNCRMTRQNADLVEVTFNSGQTLLCTPEHKLLSNGGEWICAVDSFGMVCHDALWKKSNTKELFTGSIVHSLMAIMSAPVRDICTALSMKITMGRYQKVMSSTIEMAIKPITTLLISKRWICANILLCTKKAINAGQQQLLRLLRNGAKPLLENGFAMKWACETSTLCASTAGLNANAAQNNLQCRTQERTGFAPTHASQSGAGVLGLMMSSANVHSAQSHSSSENTHQLGIAQKAVQESNGYLPQKEGSTLSVLRVRSVTQRSDVYCLEVPDRNAFALANGAIVHNCATRYGLMMLRYAVPAKPVAKKAWRGHSGAGGGQGWMGA